MSLTFLDWAIVVAYFALSIGIGFAFTKKGGESLEQHFVAGRNVPWWLAGAAMIATMFAADTPLVVTGLVAAHGVAGNWIWWNFVMSGTLTVFLYARLWRRAKVMTDVEFAEIRYAGRPAAFLRGFRAIYLGLPINCIILGWVNLAMAKILMLILGVTKLQALLIVLGILMVYVSYWLLAQALFPGLVERASHQYARPLKITMVGIAAAVVPVILGLILSNMPNPLLKLLGITLLVVPALFGLVGSTGLTLRIGAGLRSPLYALSFTRYSAAHRSIFPFRWWKPFLTNRRPRCKLRPAIVLSRMKLSAGNSSSKISSNRLSSPGQKPSLCLKSVLLFLSYFS